MENAMVVGTLEVQLLANMARLQSDMDAAKRTVSGAMQAIEASVNVAKTALLGFAAALAPIALFHMIDSAIEASAALEKLSTKTGASVEALSALKSVAKLSATDMEAVGLGLTKLTKSMFETASGSGKAQAAFESLGLNVKGTNGQLKDSAQFMQEVAIKLFSMESGTQRAAMAQLIFGKSGAQLLPLLQDLAVAGELHGKVTAEQAAQAEKFEKQLNYLKGSVKELFSSIAGGLLPTLNDLAALFVENKKRADEFQSGIRGLAKDGTITTWSDNFALGFAYVTDVINGAQFMFVQFAKSLTVVFKDIETGAKIMWSAMTFAGNGPAAIKQALDDRKKFVVEANADLEQRISQYRSNADRLKEIMDARKPAEAKGGSAVVDIANATGADEAYKAHIATIEGLQKQEQANLQTHLATLASLHKIALLGDYEYEDRRYAAQLASIERLKVLDKKKEAEAMKSGDIKGAAKYLAELQGLNNQIQNEAITHSDKLREINHHTDELITASAIADMKARGDIVGAFQAEYAKSHADDMLRAQKDLEAATASGNQFLIDKNTALIAAIEAGWKSGNTLSQFDTLRAKFSATLSEMNADIANAKLDAEASGGFASAIDAAGMADQIHAKALPALAELSEAMNKIASTSGNEAMRKQAFDLSNSLRYAASQVGDEWVTVGNEISKSLSSAFGAGGIAIGNMAKAYTSYAATKEKLDKQLADAKSKEPDPDKRAKLDIDAAKKSAVAQIGAYADIAGAAKGLFKEHSAGYKVMGDIEKGFQLMRIALMIEAAITDTATTGTSIANSVARAAAATIAGVAKCFEQMGVYGFIGAAAILAFMAALGSSSGGGASGGVAPPTAEEAQKTQGRGTVLGDATKQSESIANSLSYLQSNSDVALKYTSGMLAALQNIQVSIASVAKSLLLTTGIASGSGFGTVEGSTGSNGFLGITGGKTSTSITDSGVNIYGTLAQLAAGAGSASQYENSTTTKKGGWFSGDTTTFSHDSKALSDATVKSISLVFANVQSGLVEAAKGLGIGGAELQHTIAQLPINISASLRGLSGADLQAAMMAAISTALDQASATVLAVALPFQKVGEGLYETAIRMASGVESAKYALDKLGVSAINYTDIINTQGDVAAEIVRQSLVKKQSTGIFENVHTDAYSYSTSTPNPNASRGSGVGSATDRAMYDSMHGIAQIVTTTVVPASDTLVQKLTGIGDIMQTMTGTADDLATMYKSLIDVQKQMIAVGANGAAVGRDLIYGAGGVSALATGLKDYQSNFFTDSEKLAASTAAVSKDFAALGEQMPTTSDAFRTMMSSIDTSTAAGAQKFGQLVVLSTELNDVITAQQKSIDAAKNTLQTAFNALSSSLTALRDKFAGLATSLRAANDAMLIGAMSPLSPSQLTAQTGANFYGAVQGSKSSDTTVAANAMAQMPAAAQAFVQAAMKTSTSSVDYNRTFSQVRNAMEEAAKTADAQVSVAQRQLDGINAAVKGILDGNASTMTFQDALLAYYGIGGTKTASAVAAGGASTGPAGGQAFENYKATFDGNAQAFGDKYGGDAYFLNDTNNYAAKLSAANGLVKIGAFGDANSASQAAFGHSLAYWQEVDREFYAGMHPTTTSVQGFAVGTNYVPNDMLANIHQGERIIPAADNRQLMDRLSDSGDDNAEILAEIRDLLSDIKTASGKTAVSTKRGTDILEIVSSGGTAVRTTT